MAKFVDLAKDALEYTIHMAGNKDLDWKEEKRSVREFNNYNNYLISFSRVGLFVRRWHDLVR